MDSHFSVAYESFLYLDDSFPVSMTRAWFSGQNGQPLDIAGLLIDHYWEC